VKVLPLPEHFNPDLKCLRCGAYNIPDNVICGECGANLPVIFGPDGKPRIVTDDAARFSTITGKPHGGGFLSDPVTRGEGVRWMLRLFIVLAAIVAALWILSRR
jgi:hypothetical protein